MTPDLAALVYQLRDQASQYTDHSDLWGVAADAIESLAAENARLKMQPFPAVACPFCDSYRERAERAEAERDALRKFVADLFEESEWPEGGDIDGFAFQELATKHGILTPEERIAPCEGLDSCACSEYGGPGPTTCYRKAQWLIDAAIHPAAPR